MAALQKHRCRLSVQLRASTTDKPSRHAAAAQTRSSPHLRETLPAQAVPATRSSSCDPAAQSGGIDSVDSFSIGFARSRLRMKLTFAETLREQRLASQPHEFRLYELAVPAGVDTARMQHLQSPRVSRQLLASTLVPFRDEATSRTADMPKRQIEQLSTKTRSDLKV